MPDIGEDVQIHCIGSRSDGRVFCDTYQSAEPITFTVGSHTLLGCIERAVMGMEPGQTVRLEVPAAKAYGEYDDALVEEVPASSIPGSDELPEDGFIVVETGEELVRVHVTKTASGTVVLDHNHELAGEDLVFSVEYLGLAPESAIEHEEHAPGCSCGCDKLKESLAS